MSKIFSAFVLLVVVFAQLVCTSPVAYAQSGSRPAHWAQPVALAGVPNLYKVSDNLYRSAQPDAIGMRNLQRLGVRTVVNLRSFHSDRDELAGTRLGYVHITMKAWHPERKEAVEFLRTVNTPARTPVLVHCGHGADRTGTMVALYRCAVEGWSKDEAIREMTQGGFGFHSIWGNLPSWVRQMDIQRLRLDTGIVAAPSIPTVPISP